MKDIQRLPNTPHHRGYNLLEHSLVVGMLFRWFATEENIAYDMNVFDKVLMHDYVESITGDLNACVKKFNERTAKAWDIIESEVCKSNTVLAPYTDEAIRASMTEEQHGLFKMCDYLDLWIFCRNEIALGNTTTKITECLHNCETLMSRISMQWQRYKSIAKFMKEYEG